MFLSARMKRIEILTLVSDEPKVTEAVGEMGVLHLTSAPVESGAIPVAGPESRENEQRIAKLEERADSLCKALGADTSEPVGSVPHSTVQEVERDLTAIESEIGTVVDERKKLTAERGHIEKLLRDTSVLCDIDAPVEQLEQMSFLHFAIGNLSRSKAALAEDELGDRAVVLGFKTQYGEDKVVAISSKKGRWALESTLEKHGFRREHLAADQKGVPSQITGLAEQRLENILARTKDNNAAVRSAAERHGQRLLELRCRLRTERSIVRAREKFARTWATMLISGWLPTDRVNDLCETVLNLTGHRAVIEVRDPLAGGEKPPTMMKNHPLIRPFEMLVSSYSVPHYNEIEPTPFLAVLFLLMFGLMFGDVGHSGLLLIGGLLLWRKGKGKMHDAGVILTFCGISGIVFGLLYGSVFGFEEIVVGVFQPLRHARGLLAITVGFGVAVISLGIILNIINRLRRREYVAVSLDKFGILGGIFYWGSLAIAARAFVTHAGVSSVAVLLLIVAPLAVIFAHGPVSALLKRRRKQLDAEYDSMSLVIIESAAEAFETILMFAANTLSFARIGAFALAHAGLCIAVFELIRIVQGLPGAPVWAALVFIFGTLFIVLLEGFIVAIQALRLEYYEFFSKFFRGEGRKYEPFNLKA